MSDPTFILIQVFFLSAWVSFGVASGIASGNFAPLLNAILALVWGFLLGHIVGAGR